MDLKIVCSTWIREEDEKVLNILQESDRWMSVEELSAVTGLPERKVKRTLRLLIQQMKLYESRKRFFRE